MATATRELVIRTKFEGADAVKKIGEVEKSLDKNEKTAKRAGLSFAALGRGLVTMGQRAIAALTGLKALVGTLAAILVFRQGTTAFLNLAKSMDEVGKSAEALGTTTEYLSGLRVAAQFAGADVAQLDAALRRITSMRGAAMTGDATAAGIFGRLGISRRELAGLNDTEKMIGRIADSIMRIPDASERARAASRAFGEDAGPRLLILLSSGSAGIRELIDEVERYGGIVSGDAAARSAQFADALLRLRVAIRGVFQQLTAAGLGRLTYTINAIAGAIADNRDLVVGFVTDLMGKLIPAIVRFLEVTLNLAGNLDKLMVTLQILREEVNFLYGGFGGLLITSVRNVSKVVFSVVTETLDKIAAAILNRVATIFEGIQLFLIQTLRRLGLGLVMASGDGILKIKEMEEGFIKSSEAADEYLTLVIGGMDKQNVAMTRAEELVYNLGSAWKTLTGSGVGTNLTELLFGVQPDAPKRLSETLDKTKSFLEFLIDVLKKEKFSFSVIGDGFALGFRQATEDIIDQIKDIAGQVRSSFVGAFGEARGAAVGFFEAIYTGAKVKDALRDFFQSMMRSLISLAAQLTVILILAIAINALLPFLGLASGAGAFMGSAGFRFASGGAGAIGGAAPAISAARLAPAATSYAPMSGGAGETNITINAMDAKSFQGFLADPMNRRSVASAVAQQSRVSI
jgi:hypothetical protein